jgi:glycogen operon protein
MDFPYPTSVGQPHPLGATPAASGVNFAVYSENATAITLLLFRMPSDPLPAQTVALDPAVNRTFRIWHAFIHGLQPGSAYVWRAAGSDDLHQGFRFDSAKALIDPYARANTHDLWARRAACRPGDNVATSMRSIVVDLTGYDWAGDAPLKHPLNQTIIYEMHVGGFSRSPSAGSPAPGTFAAVVDRIPYLRELGVTAIELLPVCQFDEHEFTGANPITGQPLTNFWGYSTLGFSAPHASYCVSPGDGNHIREFRDMVKALHQADIEVILDVVFNHTGEGDQRGPTVSFRGLGNEFYYILSPTDRQYYQNYSGCGNTVNCNHPVTDKFVLDCLEFWVRDMHVDGFRFDEGSVLARGEDGTPLQHPPVIWNIELSDTLADTKVIAEAWDAAGLYQVGYFPGPRWAEWNGQYRDTIRRFVRGDRGIIGAVASRIAGSADLYQASGRLPTNSLNFVTCHDGFTLRDLVSYNSKHNEANGEGNRDGISDNLSWNCGVEGETNDPAIQALRKRQTKNFLALLALSQGVPMFLAGDELGRTQGGNNNAYCQDNPTSWIDWQLLNRNADLFRFTRLLIALRKAHAVLSRAGFFTGMVNAHGLKDVDWHGCRLHSPGWFDPNSGVLAFTLGGDGNQDADLHVMLNMEPQDLDFDLPPLTSRHWCRAVDTAQESPTDIADPGSEPVVAGNLLRVSGRSVVVLLSRDP